MRFGNTLKQLRNAVLVGLIFGGAGFLVAAGVFIFKDGRPLAALLPLTGVIVIPSIGIAVFVAPTCAFSIHVVDGWVEHRLFDRWLISRALASEFHSMITPGSFFGATLKFKGGKKIRFLGAEMSILYDLEDELHQRSKPNA